METINTQDNENSRPTVAPALYIGLWLGTSILSFFGALSTLGEVKWPEYLEYPAARALGHLAGNLPILSQGYWLYLISVLCLLPIVFEMAGMMPKRFIAASVALGSTAVIFKCLGIGRWLFAMPYLIAAYGGADNAATRSALEVQYEVLNRYVGGIGEQLGVAMFTALWVITLAAGVMTQKSAWRFATGVAGVVTTLIWGLELFLYASGNEIGAIRTVGSIATWIFLALGIGSLHEATQKNKSQL